LEHRLNWIIFTLALGMFLWSFSAGIVNISLPTISQYLDISTDMVSLIVIIHLITLISFLLVFGRIGDITGYKKIFVMGISIFTIGSYFCGISLDFISLIIFRIIQGIGSAMLLSMVPAIISTVFPPRMRGKVFGYISLTTTLGLSSGYGVGGYVTQYMGWNWIFLMVVPVGIIATIFAVKVLPSQKTRVQNVKFDVIGSLLIGLTILTFIMPFNIEENLGWGFPSIAITFVISLILGITFVIWELKHPEPLLDLSILKNVYITLSLLAGFIATLVLTGTIYLLPFYLELIMGYSSDFAGLIILIPSLVVIFIGPLSGYISDNFGSRIPTIIACITLIMAIILLYRLNQTVGILFIFAALGIRALSEGMFTPANNKTVMSHSPKEKVGSVSSLLNTARYMGLVMGIVVFNEIFVTTISNEITDLIGVPSTGAFQFSAPVGILLNGFQNAFILGIAMSVLILIFSILTKENKDYGEDEDYLVDLDSFKKYKEGLP
jgi:DHA2 family metal-tetracycline-proton antiporter-like MFS transporter